MTLTAFGELYAAWDADRNIRAGVGYIVHNKGTVFRVGNSGSTSLTNFSIRVSDATVQWTFVAAPTTNHYYLASLFDGRCLSWDGTNLALSASSATGAAVEWTYAPAETNGYYFIDHPATGKRLRMNRTNDANNTPTAVTLIMDIAGSSNDNTRWRFIKPLLQACVANPSTPSFAGLSNITAAVEGATLSWPAAAGVPPLVYEVREGTASGAENVLLDTNSLSVFVPLYPGSNSPITYFFLVKEIDGCFHYDTNLVERSIQPLLDSNKSQVGDGIPNWWKQQYGLNPFDPSLTTADRDGDGLSTFQEYLVGTSPTNSVSSFHILSVAPKGNDMLVTWMGGGGHTNVVQAATNLVNSNYFNISPNITLAGSGDIITNYLEAGGATNSPGRYYRVHLVP